MNFIREFLEQPEDYLSLELNQIDLHRALLGMEETEHCRVDRGAATGYLVEKRALIEALKVGLDDSP